MIGFDCARFVPRVVAGCLIAASPAPAFAADASAWDNDIRSAARLIAASATGVGTDRVYRAGVEIRLQPGWKTYWRYPGDSGVPPTFDFSGSDNLKAVAVLYPAPKRFQDGGGTSIGYAGEVILPLRVTAQDAGKPVKLRMKLAYAVCEKLCVPAQASAELTLTGAPSAFDPPLAATEARVPKPSQVGDAGSLAVRSVRREEGPGKPRIVVDVAAPQGVPVDLFAEGPTQDWALPLPAPVSGAPAGVHRFAFELDGLPPGVKPQGVTLSLTGVAGNAAIQVSFRLD